jgi:hypothetical protein
VRESQIHTDRDRERCKEIQTHRRPRVRVRGGEREDGEGRVEERAQGIQ